MTTTFSMADLLDFLDHAGSRGLMPAATAKALAVAARNVLGVLTSAEQDDLSRIDAESVIARFNNKRAKDFSPSSLREYGRRLYRALDLFARWRKDPANFAVKTRATGKGEKKASRNHEVAPEPAPTSEIHDSQPPLLPGTYQSAVPVRPGLVVTLANIPHDLSRHEAERLASFVRMLAVDPPA